MRFSKVYLEITNVCNLRCSFCPKTRRAPQFLSEEAFRTLLIRLQGWTEYVYFHLMGEPLLHPELSRFLEIAGEREAAALARAESKASRATGTGGGSGAEALTAAQQKELAEWNRNYPHMKMTAKEFLSRG